MLSKKDFVEKYGIPKNCLEVTKFNGNLPKESYKYIGKVSIMIDDNFFVRRKEFKAKIVNDNQQMYYKLVEHMNPHQLATILAERTGKLRRVWYSWMRDSLWSTDNKSLLHYKVKAVQWEFNKACRVLLREMN